MRVEACVHADYCRRWTFVWEHSNEDEVSVVDPVKLFIRTRVNVGFSEKGYASLACGEIGVELVVNIF